MSKTLRLIFWLTLALFFSACTPSGSERHERTIFYVATTGNNDNPCTEPGFPCLTINGALAKADADDKIIVAAGTYASETSTTTGSGNLFRLGFPIWITGAGPEATIIDARSANGGFLINGTGPIILENFTLLDATGRAPGSCINVRGTADVTIRNVELRGCAPYGIEHTGEGLVALTNVEISESAMEGTAGGDGIFNGGEMTIEGGQIFSNSTNGISNSGVMSVNGTSILTNQFNGLVSRNVISLSNVVIGNNGQDLNFRAGILVMDGGFVSVLDSIIRDNFQSGARIEAGGSLILEGAMVSGHPGAGIYANGGATTLSNTTVVRNGRSMTGTSIPGGVYNKGNMTIRNSLIAENENGGVLNFSAANMDLIETTIEQNFGGLPAFLNQGTAEIQSSLIANNFGGDEVITTSGALENRGDLTVINTTVSNNDLGGIALVDGTANLSYVTVAENGENGIQLYGGVGLVEQIANVLIVKNAIRDCSFVAGSISLAGNNIDSDDTCSFTSTYAPAAILLGPLADNGGPTFTHALLAGSPAINAASGVCPPGDQRLVLRPFGPACDVGAYEAGPVAISLEFSPTPDTPFLTLKQDYPCYTGPGPQYNTLSTLKAGEQAQIVGYGFGGGWLVAYHPTLNGWHCWLAEDFVSFDVPVADLRLIAIPPKPTPTPSPVPEDREATEVCVTPPNQPNFCN